MRTSEIWIHAESHKKDKEGSLQEIKTHTNETHGTSTDISENTPVDKVKGPNVFERAKEEIEAIAEAIHPKKGPDSKWVILGESSPSLAAKTITWAITRWMHLRFGAVRALFVCYTIFRWAIEVFLPNREACKSTECGIVMRKLCKNTECGIVMQKLLCSTIC